MVYQLAYGTPPGITPHGTPPTSDTGRDIFILMNTDICVIHCDLFRYADICNDEILILTDICLISTDAPTTNRCDTYNKPCSALIVGDPPVAAAAAIAALEVAGRRQSDAIGCGSGAA